MRIPFEGMVYLPDFMGCGSGVKVGSHELKSGWGLT